MCVPAVDGASLCCSVSTQAQVLNRDIVSFSTTFIVRCLTVIAYVSLEEKKQKPQKKKVSYSPKMKPVHQNRPNGRVGSSCWMCPFGPAAGSQWDCQSLLTVVVGAAVAAEVGFHQRGLFLALFGPTGATSPVYVRLDHQRLLPFLLLLLFKERSLL